MSGVLNLETCSSCRARLTQIKDPLVNVEPLLAYTDNWAAFVNSPVDMAQSDALTRHGRTGRPLGDNHFTSRLESETGRVLHKK